MTDIRASTYNLLRRLREQNLPDFPGVIARKMASAFTVQPEAKPETDQHFVNVVVYPQDPFVSEPEVRQMSARHIMPGLVNDRFQVRDFPAAPAQPNPQGNYLFWPGKPEFDQINSLYYAVFTLRMLEGYARHAIPWSFGAERLTIHPHAGQGGNAFYSELDHLLGFNGFADGNTIVQSAQSADVVSHETAHAALDGLRDLYNESFGLGCAAFHESFGDMTAVLVALHDDSLIQKLLNWTGGDLRLDNFIAALAEQVTDRLQANGGGNIPGRTVYLRNALNSFKNVPFDDLPANPPQPEIQLAREAHSYSRLFTGAFYDILVAIYEDQRTEKADRIAIHCARDVLGYLLVAAVEVGPVGELDFGDMAKAFLAADYLLNDSKYTPLLIPVFDKRLILPEAVAHEYCATLKHLPPLQAPAIVNSPQAASAYLTEIVTPAFPVLKGIDLNPLAAYRNSAGDIFMTYVAPHRIWLRGEQYQAHAGAHLDAFGGLTLAFNPQGQLRSLCWRPVTDEDVRQIQLIAAELIARGQMSGFTLQNADGQSSSEVHTVSGFWLDYDDGPNSLLKNPVLVDPLPGRQGNIGSYLAAWRDLLKNA
jgi:hypothetical protein